MALRREKRLKNFRVIQGPGRDDLLFAIHHILRDVTVEELPVLTFTIKSCEDNKEFKIETFLVALECFPFFHQPRSHVGTIKLQLYVDLAVLEVGEESNENERIPLLLQNQEVPMYYDPVTRRGNLTIEEYVYFQ